MENLILVLVIAFIIGTASWYIIKAKKRGVRCIGCPAAGACSGCSQKKEDL